MRQKGGDTVKSFGKALKEARKAKRTTLRELDNLIGLSIGYISDIEHGRKRPPNLNTVEKIEKFLGIKDGYLVNCANKVRNIAKPTFAQHMKMNPELSSVFLRAAELPEEKKDKVMERLRETLMEIEEET